MGAHGRAPNRTELADMMKMSKAELREKEYEIRRSDLTSLSSLAVTDSDGVRRRARNSGAPSSACRRVSARSLSCCTCRT